MDSVSIREVMEYKRDWLSRNKPESRLIEMYTLALDKGASIALDSMWRMWYKGSYYDANDAGELIKILKGA
jgi:hypothetical protein